MSVHGELVVMGATVRGTDWHGRVYTSADGEAWQLASDVRGEEPWSVDDVLSDGETVVVLASAHPCSTPNDISEAGWVLGSAWPSHLRILAGSDAAALTLLAPGEHPLAVPPVDVDCAEVQEIEFASAPYARADGAVIDGAITLLERSAEGDDEDAESYARRVVRLTDGAWEVVGVMDLPSDSLDDWLLEAGQAPALLAGGSFRTPGLARMEVHLFDGDDSWIMHESNPQIFATRVHAGGSFGGALLAAGVLHDQPFGNYRNPVGPGEFLVWRSVPVEASTWRTCDPGPEANCHGADLEEATGRLDFGDRDLTGIDLTLAQMDGADFSGTSLVEARLVGAEGSRMSFVGADLTGADLRASNLGDLAGADLTGADLSHATVSFSSAPASVDGASVAGITLRVGRSGTESGDLELSLAGLDLTNARVQGPLDPADGRLVVTDLRGAVIDNTTFDGVDLSRAEVGGVDLSGLRLDEDSICPNGEPPVAESVFARCE